MTSMLDGDLAAEVCERLSDVFISATLTRTVTEGGTPWDPSGGTTTTTDHPCLVAPDSYDVSDVDGSRIQSSDMRITVLANTLAVTPDPNTDTITVRGAQYTIMSVASDPALATWTIQARR